MQKGRAWFDPSLGSHFETRRAVCASGFLLLGGVNEPACGARCSSCVWALNGSDRWQRCDAAVLRLALPLTQARALWTIAASAKRSAGLCGSPADCRRQVTLHQCLTSRQRMAERSAERKSSLLFRSGDSVVGGIGVLGFGVSRPALREGSRSVSHSTRRLTLTMAGEEEDGAD